MDEEKVKLMIDLRVQNYFDHYLKEVLPGILKTHQQICPIGQTVSRVKWILVGAVIVVATTTPLFSRAILTAIFKI